MKRPLRYRTMGAVREGRGNPTPYSIDRKETIRRFRRQRASSPAYFLNDG